MSRSDKLRLLFYVYPVNGCFYISCIPYPISPVFWEDTRVGYYGFEINKDNKSSLYISEIKTVFPKKPNKDLKSKQYFLSSTIRAGSLSESKWFIDLFSKINSDVVKQSMSYSHMNYSYSFVSTILEYMMTNSVSSLRSISPVFHHFYSPEGTKYLTKEVELDITVDDFINLENKNKKILSDSVSVIFQDTKSILFKRWYNHLKKEI